VERLLLNLGDKDFKIRESAQKSLKNLGLESGRF